MKLVQGGEDTGETGWAAGQKRQCCEIKWLLSIKLPLNRVWDIRLQEKNTIDNFQAKYFAKHVLKSLVFGK